MVVVVDCVVGVGVFVVVGWLSWVFVCLVFNIFLLVLNKKVTYKS